MRTVWSSCALLATLLAWTPPLRAQSNAERVLNDQYSRSHDYNLVHQKIEVRDFNWDSTSFEGRVTTTVVSRAPGLDSLVLDAGHLLVIRDVKAEDGTSLATARHGDTLVVRLPHPAAFGDTLTFTIRYDGHVDNGRGLTFIEPDGRPHRPRQIWSQGEAMDNHYWFPTYDFPNDKESWEMVATVPAGYTAISNGHLVAETQNPNGTRTWDWREDRPSATYLISLVVGPYVEIKDHWHDVPVDYYVYPSDSVKARRLFAVTPDMIGVYSKLTGVPFPWAKYAQTTVADFFGGMENVSATTLVDWLPDTRAYADQPWYRWLLIPHELAHMWFGDDVTTEDWPNLWLNEGFAEFMPGQYWRVRNGKAVADDYYLDEYNDFMAANARRSMPVVTKSSNNIYPKGALVLRMLQDYLGPQRFWASLHYYLERHAFGNATTDDLRQAILTTTGENLYWFFGEWLYDAGYPKFDVSARYDTTAHQVVLDVKQTQQDTATADSTGLRYVTPRIFRMPVTVRVASARGDTVAHAWLDQREQTITVPGVDSPPTMVVFDYGDHILKTLHFDQPTSWLTAELEHDPDLWDRRWAIQQLRERTQDAAAARALVTASARADYWRTRAEAVRALASFPAKTAMRPLEVALRDTSSRVRAAAVGAIGKLGGKRAAAMARRMFRRDTSYTVRAAALDAAARAQPASVRPLILQGLATPSYRGIIASAALGAVALTHDTTLIPQVEKHLAPGDAQPDAAFVLAGLAARGSSHALDVLSAHITDPRDGVRTWVVRAMVSQLPHHVVLPRLEAALPKLTDPAARRSLQQLIDRLKGG